MSLIPLAYNPAQPRDSHGRWTSGGAPSPVHAVIDVFAAQARSGVNVELDRPLPGEEDATPNLAIPAAELGFIGSLSRGAFRMAVTQDYGEWSNADAATNNTAKAQRLVEATQAALKDRGVKSVVLYRGIADSDVNDPFRASANSRAESGKASGVTSWTTSRKLASRYATQGSGKIVKAVVPAENILTWDSVGIVASKKFDVPLPGSEVLVAARPEMVTELLNRSITAAFNPNQPRDARGRWTDGAVTPLKLAGRMHKDKREQVDQPGDFGDPHSARDIFDNITIETPDGVLSTRSYSGEDPTYEYDEDNHETAVTGTLYLDDGYTPIGEFSRILHHDDGTIYHDSLIISPDYQGHGYGSAFIAETMQRAADHGFTKVETTAVSNYSMNGAYTWLRAGFNFPDGDVRKAVLEPKALLSRFEKAGDTETADLIRTYTRNDGYGLVWKGGRRNLPITEDALLGSPVARTALGQLKYPELHVQYPELHVQLETDITHLAHREAVAASISADWIDRARNFQLTEDETWLEPTTGHSTVVAAYPISDPKIVQASAFDGLEEFGFNPNQPRDERGRWTSGGVTPTIESEGRTGWSRVDGADIQSALAEHFDTLPASTMKRLSFLNGYAEALQRRIIGSPDVVANGYQSAYEAVSSGMRNLHPDDMPKPQRYRTEFNTLRGVFSATLKSYDPDPHIVELMQILHRENQAALGGQSGNLTMSLGRGFDKGAMEGNKLRYVNYRKDYAGDDKAMSGVTSWAVHPNNAEGADGGGGFWGNGGGARRVFGWDQILFREGTIENEFLVAKDPEIVRRLMTNQYPISLPSIVRASGYNPDQPRDDFGRWTDGLPIEGWAAGTETEGDVPIIDPKSPAYQRMSDLIREFHGLEYGDDTYVPGPDDPIGRWMLFTETEPSRQWLSRIAHEGAPDVDRTLVRLIHAKWLHANQFNKTGKVSITRNTDNEDPYGPDDYWKSNSEYPDEPGSGLTSWYWGQSSWQGAEGKNTSLYGHPVKDLSDSNNPSWATGRWGGDVPVEQVLGQFGDMRDHGEVIVARPGVMKKLLNGDPTVTSRADFTAGLEVFGFNPAQPRDSHGRWTSGWDGRTAKLEGRNLDSDRIDRWTEEVPILPDRLLRWVANGANFAGEGVAVNDGAMRPEVAAEKAQMARFALARLKDGYQPWSQDVELWRTLTQSLTARRALSRALHDGTTPEERQLYRIVHEHYLRQSEKLYPHHGDLQPVSRETYGPGDDPFDPSKYWKPNSTYPDKPGSGATSWFAMDYTEPYGHPIRNTYGGADWSGDVPKSQVLGRFGDTPDEVIVGRPGVIEKLLGTGD